MRGRQQSNRPSSQLLAAGCTIKSRSYKRAVQAPYSRLERPARNDKKGDIKPFTQPNAVGTMVVRRSPSRSPAPTSGEHSNWPFTQPEMNTSDSFMIGKGGGPGWRYTVEIRLPAGRAMLPRRGHCHHTPTDSKLSSPPYLT